MSVDILMYKVQLLHDDEVRKITGMNVSDLEELDGWEIRAYSDEEMSREPERFMYIKRFMSMVEMLHTRTDYRACCVAHGMPEETKSYSICHNYGGGCMVSFDGGYIRLTREDLDEFTTTESKMYGIVKRKSIDVDISNWLARSLMNELEGKLDYDRKNDLSYFPVPINGKTRELVYKSLIKLYDKDELYPDSELAVFMLELMRAAYKTDDSVFIEFQD